MTEEDLIRLGKYKLFEFLQIQDDRELCSFIISEVGADPMDGEAFAEYLSMYYGICEHCGDEFVELPDIYCDSCIRILGGRG